MAKQEQLWRDPTTADGKAYKEWQEAQKKAPPVAAWKPSEAPRFVSLNLNDEQRLALGVWAAEQLDGDMVMWLEAQVLAGHTISVRMNEFGFQCSLTGTLAGTAHYGQSLVARGSTPVHAIQACWYRDVVVLVGEWPVGKSYEQVDF